MKSIAWWSRRRAYFQCRGRDLAYFLGFPGGSDGRESACSAGDQGLIPRSGGSAREVKGYPNQYSFLENSMDREDWQDTVHGVSKSGT